MNDNLNKVVNDEISSDRAQIKSAIGKEDKKQIKGFLILTVIGFVVGILFAEAVLFAEDSNFFMNMVDAVVAFIKGISVYVAAGLTIITIPVYIILYNGARKEYAKWDGEDEEQYKRIDAKLSMMLFVSSVTTIIAYVFMPFGFQQILSVGKGKDMQFWIAFAILIGGFVAYMVVITIAQQKAVNLSKEMNPEKKGSVFDSKFQKKWIDSCDEAEKKMIHESAFAAYKATNTTILILWFLCLGGTLIFDMGIAPMLILGTIWMVQTVAYFVKGVQLEKR